MYARKRTVVLGVIPVTNQSSSYWDNLCGNDAKNKIIFGYGLGVFPPSLTSYNSGPIVSFGTQGYTIQIGASYYGDAFMIRMYYIDAQVWRGWVKI